MTPNTPDAPLTSEERELLDRITGGNQRFRYRKATEINGHPVNPPRTNPGGHTDPPCSDYEVWAQTTAGARWTLRGWVSGPGTWTALPVNPGPHQWWTDRVPTRDEAARELLRRWPDSTGEERADPDAVTDEAPSFDDVLAAIVAASQCGDVPLGYTWRRRSSTTGRLTHMGIKDPARYDRIRDALRAAGIDAHTVHQVRGRPCVEVAIAPPVRFNTRRRNAR